VLLLRWGRWLIVGLHARVFRWGGINKSTCIPQRRPIWWKELDLDGKGSWEWDMSVEWYGVSGRFLGPSPPLRGRHSPGEDCSRLGGRAFLIGGSVVRRCIVLRSKNKNGCVPTSRFGMLTWRFPKFEVDWTAWWWSLYRVLLDIWCLKTWK
jgi:hypothetical protein